MKYRGRNLGILIGLLNMSFGLLQAQKAPGIQGQIFWQPDTAGSISWDLSAENRLPHSDNMELSGQKVSGIIHYTVDRGKSLSVKREIIFPQLRTFLKVSDPDWMQYRAYLKDVYSDDLLPVITMDQQKLELGTVQKVNISGQIEFFLSGSKGLSIKRTFFPSMTERLFVEKWTITNNSDSSRKVSIGNLRLTQEEKGLLGTYVRQVYSDGKSDQVIVPGGAYEFGVYFSARLNNEPPVGSGFLRAEKERSAFLDTIRRHLVLHTPDPVINTLFYFSKIRAAESIFQTSMGVVHSPGGGRYYTGIWANDQAEYSGPFFPYLGYRNGTAAAMNAYRKFLQNIPADGGKIPASFEMDGQLPCCSKDRGDAAMILYGATHFLLASGNKSYAQELWPLLQWCVDYLEKMKNAQGVIQSHSDELEGRFPTGTANLSTSSLYYGGLVQLGTLAKAMGTSKAAVAGYEQKAAQLKEAIELYFGAEVEGLPTYKYYKENTTLRSWISLPLVMGINTRREGTLDALFNKLWSDNGVLIERRKDTAQSAVFWDRGTLYAFRGAFKAGAAERAVARLEPFSRTRLLGFHVPYVVEAWPEGSMAHLSAESALYCRIFTEGLLGLTPAGFRSFTLKPHLPPSWENIQLNNMRAFGADLSISIVRNGAGYEVGIHNRGRRLISKTIQEGAEVHVRW